MRDDWEYIFGHYVASRLPHKSLKTLSGYHPSEHRHRLAFARHIGITAVGIDHIVDTCGHIENKLDLLEQDADDGPGQTTAELDRSTQSSEPSERVAKRWDVNKMEKNLHNMLGGKTQYIERARVYFRWTQNGRPLVTPSFLTKNIAIYKSLNILLSHVPPFPVRLTDERRWRCGVPISRSPG